MQSYRDKKDPVLLLSVTKPIFDEVTDVIVGQGVVRHLSLPAVLHQPQVPEKTQLMGNGRPAPVNDGGEIADAEFFLRQSKKQLGSGGVR